MDAKADTAARSREAAGLSIPAVLYAAKGQSAESLRILLASRADPADAAVIGGV